MLQTPYQATAAYKNWTYILLSIGVLALLGGVFAFALSEDALLSARFWVVLLQNSMYFLMLTHCAMFFLCAVILAMGGWMVTFKRIPEVISALTPVYAAIVLLILLMVTLGGQYPVYHWLDTHHVAHDSILTWKAPFLNIYFFLIFSVVSLLLWVVLGMKMRALSRKMDTAPAQNVQQAKRLVFTNTVWAGVFMAVFTLTMASVLPWLWMLSIDAHWYSSIYSWYVLASVFSAALALIVLYVLLLKRQNYLPLTNKEHLHDLGKLVFGFSAFWAYLWYAQYMLIWYADLPEETVYFKIRQQGPYAFFFYFNFVINFILPFFLLMARDTKRNAVYMMLTALLVIAGHWIDFFQMMIPGVLGAAYGFGWFEWGVFIFFIGLTMFLMQKKLRKTPLLPVGDPYLKESIVHEV